MHAVQQINHALLTLPVDIYLQISFRTNNFSKQCSVYVYDDKNNRVSNISFNPFELIIDFCFCLKKKKINASCLCHCSRKIRLFILVFFKIFNQLKKIQIPIVLEARGFH